MSLSPSNFTSESSLLPHFPAREPSGFREIVSVPKVSRPLKSIFISQVPAISSAAARRGSAVTAAKMRMQESCRPERRAFFAVIDGCVLLEKGLPERNETHSRSRIL